MKSKSTAVPKEKGFLHVCRKSNVISKSNLSHLRLSKNLEIIRSQDKDARSGEEGDALTNHFEASTEEKCFHMTESATKDTMEHLLSLCLPTDPPVLESVDFLNSEVVPQLSFAESDDICKSSAERLVCNNTSEFDMSEVICSASTIGNNNTIFDDNKSEESTLVCCTRLPMLEDHSEASHNDHKRPLEGTTVLHSEPLRLHTPIHQSKNTRCDQLDVDPNFPGPTEAPSAKRITLVLDLDETLVHSAVIPCDDADFTFNITLNMKELTVYVKQRPHLHHFLKRVSEMFEVVIFTASQSVYAKPLLDILDPHGAIISRRAYRESCSFSCTNYYIKDLTVLGVDLARVAIIDNSPQVFHLQMDNGIPIKTWIDDPSDCELISLLPFLETLANAEDVRSIIAREFGFLQIPLQPSLRGRRKHLKKSDP